MPVIIPHVTIQVTGVQQLQGRQHDYVRVFGYRAGDAKDKKTIVELVLEEHDASDIIVEAKREGKFPEVEVAEHLLVYVLNASNVKLLQFEKAGPMGGRK